MKMSRKKRKMKRAALFQAAMQMINQSKVEQKRRIMCNNMNIINVKTSRSIRSNHRFKRNRINRYLESVLLATSNLSSFNKMVQSNLG